MDPQQADAKASSVMGADLDRQRHVQAGLAAAERVNRLSAVIALTGFCAGGMAGYLAGFATVRSALVGGLVAFFLCRVVFWVLGRRAIAPKLS